MTQTIKVSSTAFDRAQNIESILAETEQVIKLSVSTPQPRLNEVFRISIDINHLTANIFKSLAANTELSNDIGGTDYGELTLNVKGLKQGKNEIGPLEFFLDKTKYTTNKIGYEVIDPLPNTDKGLWFRKVMTSDNTFCIVIEQRIPVNDNASIESDNLLVKYDFALIKGVSGGNAHVSKSLSSAEINGEEKEFIYSYSIYYFIIEDRKSNIIITKNEFQNIPADYQFDDIIIQ